MKRQQRPSVFLYGAWKQNLGDDLFLKIISERYPNCVFHILTKREHKSAYSNMTNVIVHTKDAPTTRILNTLFRIGNSPEYVFKKMSRVAQAIVFLGGSLYQQEKNWKRLYKQRVSLTYLFHDSFAIGNNFGPYSDPDFYNSYKIFFQRMNDVCFRDHTSKNLFPYPNVRVASDVVFGLKNHCKYMDEIPLSECPKERYVVISVINLNLESVSRKFNTVNAETYEMWIEKLVAHLEERGYAVVLMGFCEAEKDGEAIDRIISDVHSAKTIKFIHNDIDSSLAIIKGADMVVATRFHAMILGWIFDKRVLPIVYGSKMKHVIEDVGFDGCRIDIERIESYDPDRVLEDSKALNNVSWFSRDASKQFQGFDQWLECFENKTILQ